MKTISRYTLCLLFAGLLGGGSVSAAVLYITPLQAIEERSVERIWHPNGPPTFAYRSKPRLLPPRDIYAAPSAALPAIAESPDGQWRLVRKDLPRGSAVYYYVRVE